MGIEQWWPDLQPSTRQWLIAHNGEPLPEEIVREIRRVGGAGSTGVVPADAEARSVGLSDDAVDWIEAVANEERPEAE